MFNTHVNSPEIVTETNTKTDIGTDTDIDIDKLITVLDHRYGYSSGFDSTEFVLFNHSQRISVVTKD